MYSRFEIYIRGSDAQNEVRSLVLNEMRERVCDNMDLSDTAMPEHEYGARSIVFSDTYLEALDKPNVALRIGSVTSAVYDGLFAYIEESVSQLLPLGAPST